MSSMRWSDGSGMDCTAQRVSNEYTTAGTQPPVFVAGLPAGRRAQSGQVPSQPGNLDGSVQMVDLAE